MMRQTLAQTQETRVATPVGDALADESLAALRAHARNAYWKARFGVTFAMLPGILAGLGGWFASYFLLRSSLGDDWAALVGMVVYGLGIACGVHFGVGAYGRRSKAELSRITEHADARAIRPLTDMVRGNVWAGTFFLLPSLRAIVAALSRILAAVRPEDRASLEDADLAGIRSILASCANHYGWLQAGLFTPEFIRAALQALGTLGDGHAAPLAERLTHAMGVGRRCAEVRRIAQEALPALRKLSERERARSELLRPAGPPGPTGETLLRPAAPGQTGDDELLVRPVEQS